MSSAENKAATLQAILGLAFALLPSGLNLIGITVNLLWGALILLVCCALVTGALWIWAAGIPWCRRWLRLAMVIVATVSYLAIIGRQTFKAAKENPTEPEAKPALSLSVLASLESNAQSADGDFWVVRNAAPGTLIATNRACFLRVVNLQDYQIRIDKLTAEVLLANGNWEGMRLVSMIGAKDIYSGSVPKKLAHVDLAALSFEMNTEIIPAKGSAEGWLLFDYPKNDTATSSRIRISVTDDHGNVVWATGAPTMSDGGLRGAPIPIIGFDDLSGYSIKRLPED